MKGILFYSVSTLGLNTSDNLKSVRGKLSNAQAESVARKKLQIEALTINPIDRSIAQKNNRKLLRIKK